MSNQLVEGDEGLEAVALSEQELFRLLHNLDALSKAQLRLLGTLQFLHKHIQLSQHVFLLGKSRFRQLQEQNVLLVHLPLAFKLLCLFFKLFLQFLLLYPLTFKLLLS